MSRADLDRQLGALRDQLHTMTTLVDDVLDRALTSLRTGEAYDAHMAQGREEDLDGLYEGIEEQTTQLLTLQQPVIAADLRFLIGTLIVGQRLQRAGHSGLGVARLALDLAALETFEAPPPQLAALGEAARAMLRDAVTAFVENDVPRASETAGRDTTVDTMYRTLRDQILRDLSATSSAVSDENRHRRLTFWLWTAHKLERVADHSVVIARRVQQMQ